MAKQVPTPVPAIATPETDAALDAAGIPWGQRKAMAEQQHREQNQGYEMANGGVLIDGRILAELRRKAAVYDENEKSLKRFPLMYAALLRIHTWFGMFPETGQFWDTEQKQPMSYAACYGSNGERDFMREVAREALELPI